MKAFLQKLTWQDISTAACSLLASLAVAPYELGDVALLIPPEWKAKVFFASAIAAFLLRVIKKTQSKPTVEEPKNV